MNDRNDILNELNQEKAGVLFSLKNNWRNPFVAPKGYFEELPISLKAISIDRELLAKAKTNAFTVPENYFEDLKSSLKDISKENSRETKTISLAQYQQKKSFSAWKYVRSFSAVAASLLVIILGWKMINTPEIELSAERQLAQAIGNSFSENELQSYIESYYLDTDETELLSDMAASELDLIETELFDVPEEYIYENLDVSDLENYYDII